MSSHEQPVLYSVDFSGCVAMPELTPESMTDAFISTLKNAGATIVEAQSHHFPGKGLTCVLILAESHAVLHTWPETGTVNLDIFSCSSRLKSLEAIVDLGKVLGASGVSVQEVLRADGHATSADGRR
jgi:S-adenosylmethionine decarboxylase